MSYVDKVIERRDAVKAEMDAVLEAVAADALPKLAPDNGARPDFIAAAHRIKRDDGGRDIDAGLVAVRVNALHVGVSD